MLDKVERGYPFPPYSPFPRSEFAHRIQRLKEEMEVTKLAMASPPSNIHCGRPGYWDVIQASAGGE